MASPTNPSGLLKSWKEIAAYLHRDVRTAIRWEKERGLPVRRPPGSERARHVYAFKEELDAWALGLPSPAETVANEIREDDHLQPAPLPVTVALPQLAARSRPFKFVNLLYAVAAVIPLVAFSFWPTGERSRPLAMPLQVSRADYQIGAISGGANTKTDEKKAPAELESARKPGGVQLVQASPDGIFARAVAQIAMLKPLYVAIGDFGMASAPERQAQQSRNGGLNAQTPGASTGFLSGAFLPLGGTQNQRQVTADFNGDGLPDVAVLGEETKSIEILMGRGDGGFETKQSIPVEGFAGCIATADFNHDGKADLVACNYRADGKHSVEIYLGNGNGTFRPERAYALDARAHSVAIADFDGDGNPDLAAATSQNRVAVLKGNGDGTFRPPASFESGEANTFVTTADIDRDGRPDLVALGAGDGSLSFLRGNGDGTFGAPQTWKTGKSAGLVAVGDFDGDGRLDVAVSDMSGDTVSVFLNRSPSRERTLVEKMSAVWSQWRGD